MREQEGERDCERPRERERVEIQELTKKVQPARDERGASKLISISSSGEGAEIQKLSRKKF